MTSSTDVSHGDLLASDAERERVAALLREHAAEGRLGIDELSERVERAYGARTRSALADLTRDLPPATTPTREPQHREDRRELARHVASFVLVNVLLIGIWAASGAGYFWPVWPLLGWGVGLASHVSGARFGGPCGRHSRAAHRPSRHANVS